MKRDLQPLLLAGPTAVGKSAVALELAILLDGEIVSVDSMQVYRGLDIGTAKPSREERERVPHHLIDILDLNEGFDAAQFAARAHAALHEIQQRGRVPILCGGTGLYLKAFQEGLGDAPKADVKLRTELEQIPISSLLAELQKRDPIAFEKIDRQNRRRVVRAIEVIRLTGKPFTEQRAVWPDAATLQPRFFGLRRVTEDLRSRINRRVDEMFRQGLVEETRQLLNRGLANNRTALQAIGYAQAVEYLRGERTFDATIDLVKTRTRQFAKRQMTWFRRQTGLQWIDLSAGDEPGKTALCVLENLKSTEPKIPFDPKEE